MQHRQHPPGFTLIELLVVITLMGIATGLVVFRLDGVTDRGRLRSAANRIGAWIHTSTVQARTTGMPRLIQYEIGADRFTLRLPERRDGVWQWGEPRPLLTGTGAKIERVLIEGEDGVCDVNGSCSIRIGADGRCVSHAVILSLHKQQVVLIFGIDSMPTIRHLEEPSPATTYDLLLLELVKARERT